MLDRYKEDDHINITIDDFRSVQSVTAPSEEICASVFKDRKDVNIAAMVNFEDHNFLQAVHALVTAINKTQSCAQVSIKDFVESALRRELGNIALKNETPQAYEKETSQTRSEIDGRNIHFASDYRLTTKISMEKEGKSQLVAYTDHEFLQTLRDVFQQAGRSDNIAEELAAMLIKEFFYARGDTHIPQLLVSNFGKGESFIEKVGLVLNEDTNTYLWRRPTLARA